MISVKAYKSRLHFPGTLVIYNSEFREANIDERAHYLSGMSIEFLMFQVLIGIKKKII